MFRMWWEMFREEGGRGGGQGEKAGSEEKQLPSGVQHKKAAAFIFGRLTLSRCSITSAIEMPRRSTQL